MAGSYQRALSLRCAAGCFAIEHQAEALGGAAGGGVVHVGVLSRIGVGGGLEGRRGAIRVESNR